MLNIYNESELYRSPCVLLRFLILVIAGIVFIKISQDFVKMTFVGHVTHLKKMWNLPLECSYLMFL